MEDKDIITEPVKKPKNLLTQLLIGFVALNLLVFVSTFIQIFPSKGSIKAKLCLSASSMTNFLYVIPIEKAFGFDSSAVKPFKSIRNKLYDKCLSYYDQKDGEREMWWFLVKFSEFQRVTTYAITSYKTEKADEYPIGYLDKLSAEVEDIYNHIEPFATLKIESKNLEKTRLFKLADMLHAYHYDKESILYRQEPIPKNEAEKELSYYDVVFTNKELMPRYIKAFNTYLKYKEYCQKHDQKQLKYAESAALYYHMPTVEMVMSRNIMLYKILHDKFTCNDPLLKVYGDARNILDDMYYRRRKGGEGKELALSMILSHSCEEYKLDSMCQTNVNLKNLNDELIKSVNTNYGETFQLFVDGFDEKYKRFKE